MSIPVLVLLAAQAMSPPPACTAMTAPPPALAAWSRPVGMRAAADAAGAAQATLATGAAADVALQPVAAVRYASPPVHAGKPGTFGGLVRLDVATAGRYQVAVGAGAWIDMVAGSRAVPSVAHGQGPACTGIRKTVSFDLTPGQYLLQLSGAPSATVEVLAALQPN